MRPMYSSLCRMPVPRFGLPGGQRHRSDDHQRQPHVRRAVWCAGARSPPSRRLTAWPVRGMSCQRSLLTRTSCGLEYPRAAALLGRWRVCRQLLKDRNQGRQARAEEGVVMAELATGPPVVAMGPGRRPIPGSCWVPPHQTHRRRDVRRNQSRAIRCEEQSRPIGGLRRPRRAHTGRSHALDSRGDVPGS